MMFVPQLNPPGGSATISSHPVIVKVPTRLLAQLGVQVLDSSIRVRGPSVLLLTSLLQ